MQIEYYLLQGKKKIRKYKKVRTKSKVIALKTFRDAFKKAFKNSSYQIIEVY
jgi:hypothetical protein